MSRRRTQKKRSVMPDPVYDSRLVELIVRQIMRKGKKSLAYKIMYETMTQIAETNKGPENQIPSAGCGIKWKTN